MSDVVAFLPASGNSCGLQAARIPFERANNLDEVLQQIKRVGKAKYRTDVFKLLDGTRELAAAAWPGPKYHTESALSDEALEKQILLASKGKEKAAKGGQRALKRQQKTTQQAKIPTWRTTLQSHLALTSPGTAQRPSPAGLSPVSIGAIEAGEALKALEASQGAGDAQPRGTGGADEPTSLATLNARLAKFGLAPLAELPTLPDRPLEAADYEPSGWVDVQAAPPKPAKAQKATPATQLLQGHSSCFAERLVSAPMAPTSAHTCKPAESAQNHQSSQPIQPTYSNLGWQNPYAEVRHDERVFGGGAIPTYTLPSPAKCMAAPPARQQASHAAVTLKHLPQPVSTMTFDTAQGPPAPTGEQVSVRSTAAYAVPQICQSQQFVQYYY